MAKAAVVTAPRLTVTVRRLSPLRLQLAASPDSSIVWDPDGRSVQRRSSLAPTPVPGAPSRLRAYPSGSGSDPHVLVVTSSVPRSGAVMSPPPPPHPAHIDVEAENSRTTSIGR